MKKISLFFLFLFSLNLVSVNASDSDSQLETSLRGGGRFGLSLGIGGPPISYLGLTASYLPTSNLKIYGEVGTTILSSTFGGGVDFIAFDESPVALTFGPAVYYISMIDFIVGPIVNAFNGDEDDDIGTINFLVGGVRLGMDWTTRGGFNLVAGAHITTPLYEITDEGGPERGKFAFIPYLSLGALF